MLIGTSLGRCMVSILSGDVPGDKVGLIITRTRAETFEDFMKVIDEYYDYGNPSARGHRDYNLGQFNRDDVYDLAYNLWHGGRIHQPRNFDSHFGGYLMPEMSGTIWMEIVPTNNNSNENVVQAYETYRILRGLAE